MTSRSLPASNGRILICFCGTDGLKPNSRSYSRERTNRAFLDPVDQVVAETAFAVVGMYDPEGPQTSWALRM
jgi:hypothetical protein